MREAAIATHLPTALLDCENNLADRCPSTYNELSHLCGWLYRGRSVVHHHHYHPHRRPTGLGFQCPVILQPKLLNPKFGLPGIRLHLLAALCAPQDSVQDLALGPAALANPKF